MDSRVRGNDEFQDAHQLVVRHEIFAQHVTWVGGSAQQRAVVGNAHAELLFSGNRRVRLRRRHRQGSGNRYARPPTPDAAHVAAHDDTVLYVGCPDVDAAYRHLRTYGLVVQAPRVTHHGMKQLYVRVPDGFSLCFQWTAEVPPAVSKD